DENFAVLEQGCLLLQQTPHAWFQTGDSHPQFVKASWHSDAGIAKRVAGETWRSCPGQWAKLF
ncbi:MAG: hypothetical protein KDJ36_14670, partial [Hyphomicrobiaceae bacterium]|nr:hypothetical protein [Hyphomicrobiaceae bacterium]